jgi:peptidylprolyl isomerase
MRYASTSAAAVFFLSSLLPSMTFAGDEIVARLGTTELRQSQLRTLLDNLDTETRRQLLASPDSLNQLARSEILRLSILKEAMDKKWDKRSDVLAQLDKSRAQIILSSYMNEISRPEPAYPSDAEIRQFYEANQSAFAVPARYHLAQIFIAETDRTASQPGKEIESLALQAKANDMDFTRIAKQYSQHRESAQAGGDMGWVAENMLIPELREKITAMAIGETSKPVHSNNGWHIIRLLGKQPASTRQLTEAKDTIKATLRLERARHIEQKYLMDKLKTGDLKLYATPLDELQK